MKYTLTKLFASLAIIVFSGSIAAFAQFTVAPTAITTTGTSGSTATGTQSVSVNWTFTGSNQGATVTATYTVNGVSASPVTCVKSGTGGTRTYTCPVANINLSWSAVCGGAVSSYSASATTTHPAPTPAGGPTTITATCTVPLAVSKTDVVAKVEGNDVELSWKGTNASVIERYEVQELVKNSFQTVATIQNVNTLTKTFSNLPAGKHTFRVVSFGTDGSTLQSDAIEVEIILPGAFELTDAYPNPFNPMTKFTLTVAKTQNVRVEVYNLQGQLVTTLFNGQVQAKEVNTLNFNAANLPSGTYIYQAIGETFRANKKIVLVK